MLLCVRVLLCSSAGDNGDGEDAAGAGGAESGREIRLEGLLGDMLDKIGEVDQGLQWRLASRLTLSQNVNLNSTGTKLRKLSSRSSPGY